MNTPLQAVDGIAITEFWFLFNGKFQDTDEPTGLEKARLYINAAKAGPHHIVEQHEWDVSPAKLADRIIRWRETHGTPRINIIGYSLGGNTANRLASECDQRNLMVHSLWLLDAKYYLTTWVNWLSYFNYGEIKVPPNVINLRYWRQRNERPSGSPVVSDERLTRPRITVDNSSSLHAQMDEHAGFYDELQKEIEL